MLDPFASKLPTSQVAAKLITVKANGDPLPTSDARYVSLDCQFNPSEVKVKKEVDWSTPDKLVPARNSPDLDFGGGKPAEYSLTLYFDTTRETTGSKDVRGYTQQLLKLVMLQGPIAQRLPPPRVQLQWGKFFMFLAVVTSVEISYTLFLADGTPVRAQADVSLQQFDDNDDFTRRQNPTSRTEARRTRVVLAGDRLDQIAYEEYGHPSHWRFLAEQNGIIDPFTLTPGQVLVVPKLP